MLCFHSISRVSILHISIARTRFFFFLCDLAFASALRAFLQDIFRGFAVLWNCALAPYYFFPLYFSPLSAVLCISLFLKHTIASFSLSLSFFIKSTKRNKKIYPLYKTLIISFSILHLSLYKSADLKNILVFSSHLCSPSPSLSLSFSQSHTH